MIKKDKDNKTVYIYKKYDTCYIKYNLDINTSLLCLKQLSFIESFWFFIK